MKCPNCGGHQARFKASRTGSLNQKKSLVRKRKRLPRKKGKRAHQSSKKDAKPREDFTARCPDCGFEFDARNYV
ncbi:MAG: hypothetical protein OEZ21_02495 [Candidatus Bathyarchaeota archaeon]|nr:hypothetical protein [Candidatus Bathyarchaeota archaeon]MDH5745816.1 hypothetical protein [Candidatus Bathyarchaeota archaeon]